MTSRIAIAIGLVIALAIAGDVWLAEGAGTLFLLRKLFALLDWMAFWR